MNRVHLHYKYVIHLCNIKKKERERKENQMHYYNRFIKNIADNLHLKFLRMQPYIYITNEYISIQIRNAK